MSVFEEKVKKEILKTGLPTEIKVTDLLKQAGWKVFNEYPYLDTDENKIRTLDLRAKKTFMKKLNTSQETSKINLACELYIECKKSSKQSWVFYTETLPQSYLEFSIQRMVEDIFSLSYNLA